MDINTTWQCSSESTLLLFLGGEISLDKQKLCWALANHLRADNTLGVREVVVGMNALMVYLDKQALYQDPSQLAVCERLLNELTHDFAQNLDNLQGIQGKHIDIPVIYGGECGVDLVASAKTLGISVDELVKQHTAPLYTVYFIGFQAGFPYLGGLPKALHLPRHAKPRTKVLQGSVGIGGGQTGIYPFESPGGWQLLGRTTLPLFDKSQNPPTLLQAGDTLRFVATEILV